MSASSAPTPSAPGGAGHGPKRPGTASSGPKRPYHVGVAIGLTTGAYAASLLVVSRLQIATDRGIIADRTPVEAAIAALGDHHDWMDDRLAEARSQYAIGAAGFEELQARLARMDGQLAKLDSVVRSVEQLGNSLSTTLQLPAVPPRSTSAGSGGGSGGSSGGSSGGGTIKAPPPAPKPAPAPPTSGQTGASGG